MNHRPAGRPSIFKKEEAQSIALDLFWAHGFEETSIDQLTQTIGINRSSFFRSFTNKESIFKSCVEDYVRQRLAFIPGDLAEKSLRDGIENLLHHSIDNMTQHAPARGCFIVQGLLNCSERNQDISDYLKQKRMLIENLIRKRVQQAQVSQEIPAGRSAVDITKTIMTVYCGLSVQAASGASQKELNNVAKLILKTIDI